MVWCGGESLRYDRRRLADAVDTTLKVHGGRVTVEATPLADRPSTTRVVRVDVDLGTTRPARRPG